MNTYFFSDTEDLISEHFAGHHSGMLLMAQDFVLRHLATHGQISEEQLAEAGAEEGFGEAEIAAALAILSGDYEAPEDPRGVEWLVK